MSWTTVQLGDFITLKRGYDLPERSRVAGSIPIVSSSGITGTHNEAKVDGPGVVTGRYGTLGEVFYIDEPFWPLNTALYVQDFKGNQRRFVSYFLKSILGGTQSDKAAVPGVNRNDLHARKVLVTKDLQEQATISSILASYDDLIENNRRRIQLLEESARLLYKEWFVRLRFPGHEHVNVVDGVPEGWEKKELGSICTLRAGGSFKTKYQGNDEGDLPFIKVRDMNGAGNSVHITGADNWVTNDECYAFKGKPFPVGTIVFAKIGEALRKNRIRALSRDTLIDNNMMGAIPKDKISTSFLYILLSSYDFNSNASGAAVPFLSAKVLAAERFLVPKKSIRLQFDDFVSPVFQQILDLQLQSVEAAKARDLLLPRLMNGEVAV
ncbi:restriction endonuclease subunit S [Desulfocurvibacter africanus]|uniref:restriction endonuclease subunit S n=1 Tax=Desulfocurvibacter africanus TaxID=873 RepID=UPI0003F711DF|nr:restriction endonuclease subunit S [Desulfocurvibacter africanus]